jgi:hypothetical protein
MTSKLEMQFWCILTMTGEGEKRWKQTEEYGRKEQRAKHKVEI